MKGIKEYKLSIIDRVKINIKIGYIKMFKPKQWKLLTKERDKTIKDLTSIFK